jgi:hypothetical protein
MQFRRSTLALGNFIPKFLKFPKLLYPKKMLHTTIFIKLCIDGGTSNFENRAIHTIFHNEVTSFAGFLA